MARSNAVWGIDVGNCSLKAMRGYMDDSNPGAVIVDAVDYIEYSQILTQPGVDADAEVREALKLFLSRNSIKGDKIAFAMSGQNGLVRFLKLPPIEPKKIPEIVKYEAKQQIAFLNEVIWKWQRMGQQAQETAFPLKVEIGLFAVKRDQIFKMVTMSDSLGIPMFSQEVTAEWPSEAAARSATATIVELDDGERYLWTSRWDDRNPNHGPLTRALNAVGMPTTCYVNGHSSTNYTPLLREIVASGNAIGAHTISHKHMKNLSPMKCFQEIMQCRVELEIDSQSPVVAFATPYGLWNSSVGSNMKICGEALRNAGFLGGAEGAGNSCAKFGLSSNVWVGAYVFDANDKKPDRVAFGKGFRTGIARIDKGGAGLTGPTFALGVHPWQNEQGRADLAAMVKESLAATPGLKTMTMNRYVARRLQFLSSTVEKMAVDGRCATFRVTRPRVCELGAKAPVLVRLSDGRILHVDAPAVEDVPKAFVRSDGELRVSDDRSKFI